MLENDRIRRAPALGRDPGRAALFGMALIATLAAFSYPGWAEGIESTACAQTTGQLHVPTMLQNGPPVLTPTLGNDVMLWYIPSVTPGEYTLNAQEEPVQVADKVFLPDFNVLFLNGNTVTGHNTEPGDQSGSVPGGTTEVVVYMRYGPDLLSDQHIGAGFFFRQGC